MPSPDGAHTVLQDKVAQEEKYISEMRERFWEWDASLVSAEDVCLFLQQILSHWWNVLSIAPSFTGEISKTRPYCTNLTLRFLVLVDCDWLAQGSAPGDNCLEKRPPVSFPSQVPTADNLPDDRRNTFTGTCRQPTTDLSKHSKPTEVQPKVFSS